MKREDNSNTGVLEGNIWKQVLFFALPIAAASMLQQLFNATDTAVVGRFASSQALAAVGSTLAAVNLCITILTGLSVGTNVRIAHAIGAGAKKEVKRGVDTAMLLAVVTGILLTVIGEAFARPLLQAMNTPEDIIDGAVLYLRVYFLGIPFLMIYNFEAAILRASGDSMKPLYCLFFAGILNLGFNMFFVIVLHMGVVGVALGTLISNVVNVVLLLYFLVKGNGVVQLDLRTFSPDREICRSILAIGLPAALQGMTFNIANLIIQVGLNGLGSDVVAASTIGLNGEVFVYYLLNGFGQAAVTFNGQNLGAGNIKRCRQALRACMVLGGILTFLMSVCFVVAAEPFGRIFATDPRVIAMAAKRIQIILYFEVFNMTIEVLSGVLRGLGHSALPAALSIVFICVTRILWVGFVFPVHHSYEWLLAVYPVSWILDTAAIAIAYFAVIEKIDNLSFRKL